MSATAPAAIEQRSRSTSRLTRNRIATLSSGQINRMKDDELCRIIRSACLSFIGRKTESRMPMQDRPTLVRMAFVVRRSCQHLALQPE